MSCRAPGQPDPIFQPKTLSASCMAPGLHTLLAAHKRAQAEGGELLLVIPSPAVLRVFAITSVDRMIPNFTSLEEALARTSANGSNGHRRASRGLEKQHSASGLDEGAS